MKISDIVVEWFETKEVDSFAEDELAFVALNARKSIGDCKPTQYIKEFIEVHFGDYSWFAICRGIIKYMYPPNPSWWSNWDKIYLETVEASPRFSREDK